MNALETDPSEALRLARSLKNSLVPINKLPVEILSMIPDYFDEDEGKEEEEDEDMDFDEDIDEDWFDEALLALTHVCRHWREVFTSRSSLWTKLDLTNADKTKAYLQRSGTAPLEIDLIESGIKGLDGYLEHAISLVIPHIPRVKTLSIYVGDVRAGVFERFYCHMPLLESLRIENAFPKELDALDDKLFDGDLSSLRELTLIRFTTRLPWNNLANLNFLVLENCIPKYDVTRILDVFESAPLLRVVRFGGSLPVSSYAPPNRIVALPHLKHFVIITDRPHSILLEHLCIPAGATLFQIFNIGNEEPLVLRRYVQEGNANLKNLSHITTVALNFAMAWKVVELNGPSGCLYYQCTNLEAPPSHHLDRELLRSLRTNDLSKAQKLSVTRYTSLDSAEAEESPIFQTLSRMNNLRTLNLTKCDNEPFILALNPQRNSSKRILCPNLEELVLYADSWNKFHINLLCEMAKNRASSGAMSLSSITLVGLHGLAPREDESDKLKEHVPHVDYRVDDKEHGWYSDLEDDSGDESD